MCADTSSFTRARFLSKDKYTECTRFLANVTGYLSTKERKRRSIMHKRFREKRLIFANNKNSSADIIYEIVKSNSCSGCDFLRIYRAFETSCSDATRCNTTARHLECPVWEKNHSLTGARTRIVRFRAYALSNCATRIGKNFNLKNHYLSCFAASKCNI